MIAKFYTLLFFLFFLQAFPQEPVQNKKGTITVKKPAGKKILALKKQKLRFYYFSLGRNYRYKITFPKSYTSDLYPLIFNNQGMVITGCCKEHYRKRYYGI
jgi:hypothetical protein